MGFTTKRGRPKSATAKKPDEKDLGTVELQAKRSLGVTAEAIDICKEKQLVGDDEYSAALHFRWLYTVKFGAPTVSAVMLDGRLGCGTGRNDEAWQEEREREYAMAIEKLRAVGALKIVMNIVVFNHFPSFLSIASGFSTGPEFIQKERELAKFRDGLSVLKELWGKFR